MKKRLLLILLLAACWGCQPAANSTANTQTAEKTPLTVSAAVSLKEAFGEIGNLYQSKTGRSVNFNFSSSGALQKQIETGAPADVFASAGEKQMDELADKGLLDSTSRRNFAANDLVLIVPAAAKSNLADFAQLGDLNIQKVAVGNPKTVPAGQYTEQFLAKTGLNNKIQSKLIFAEDVRQVLDYVVRGETDAGLVYASDARIADDKVRVVATAPAETHDPILYPLAIIKDSRQKPAAEEFIELTMSNEGQAILQKYGFRRAGEK